ncbi:phosphate transporter [Amylocarpus encephaloides]|uniref:Phosphate transporter n=1 Tax=Amylocarpus encephaloides TaxID=45428 RepID=A0A9P8C6R0_9HELO|nr:phosphate transporter [Amylocarpus encephaloides]
MAVLDKYSWIIALISIAFCVSSFGNGANDVANSYATSVAARTLTMPQVGILAMVTEFVGAVALGSRVTGTIKGNVIDIKHFTSKPATLILIMGCTEFGSAAWLMFATKSGFPVSTTQTVVGALVGAGIAAGAKVQWSWKKGSVSQIAASWAIAPLIAAGFAAILFGTIKFAILERKDPFKWAMRLIPVYLAFTAAVLALFMVVEIPNGDSLEDFGIGKILGVILGVFFGVLAFSYAFFIPYFHRRLVLEDTRIRSWHIPLGPLLWRDNPPLYFPSKGSSVVKDYSGGAKTVSHSTLASPQDSPEILSKGADEPHDSEKHASPVVSLGPQAIIEPREKYLGPTDGKPIYHPLRLAAWINYIFWRGVSKDCVSFDAEHLESTHSHATIYDNKVEHLWTYAQVASAMMMSIAHGSNDVANAVAPWVAAYNTFLTGKVTSKADTPVWILVIAGFLLGTGFWFFGYHIIRSLGNRITRVSPTRGFSIELGAAITVLLASQLALPVSTTQCLTGATVGVALMNFDAAAVNWKQLAFIFSGWVLTLPSAGLIAGLLTAMALNTPHF